MSALKVLAVDDDDNGLYALECLLKEQGYEVVTASSGKQTLEQVSKHDPDIVLLDVQMPAPDGYQVTKLLKADERFRFIPVILLTGKDDLEDIVFGLEQGADDYIKKPYQPKELIARLHSATRIRKIYLELRGVLDEAVNLRKEVASQHSYENIIGNSEAIKSVFRVLDKIRNSSATVLIGGESGTGKELIAKTLHYSSPRKNKPFVASNVSALQDTLLESELFGHVKGAFTGAIRDRIGLFETANGGTLFLDEIAEMSSAMQTKLLRVLQDGTFTPVGDTKVRKVDVRVIGATHRNLHEMITKGTFREDLYYRLNVIQIELPPLRQRKEDIPCLVNHFLQQIAKRDNLPLKNISSRALDILIAYDWPGNIRQLQNEVERMVIMSEENPVITEEFLSNLGQKRVSASLNLSELQKDGVILGGTLKDAIATLEKTMLAQSLKRNNGNKSEVARELDISRSSVISKVHLYGLEE